MKKLLLLDLDNTLFDSSSLRRLIYEELGKLLTDKDNAIGDIINFCNSIGKEMIVKKGYFSPDEFIKELSKKIDLTGKEKKVRLLIVNTELSKSFMHTEVDEVLSNLSKKVSLGIFSQGEVEFQKSKLHSILHFFPAEYIHFEKDKKHELERVFSKYKDFKIYYVDDRIHILEHSKKINKNVFTIWIKRGEYAEGEKTQSFQPDAIIQNLNEIIPIVENK